MSKELVINTTPKGNRISLLIDKKLVEYHFESKDNNLSVGDIYLGTVTKLAPNLNAAFVNIGEERDAFLHYLDLSPRIRSLNKFVQTLLTQRNGSYKLSNLKLEPDIDKLGKIVDVLKKDQPVLVQIAKEPISTKGARLTCELSLPGRYLVMVPFGDKVSVSRKIESKEEKRRLLRLVESIKPKNFGVVIRTVAEGKDVAELDRDLQDLLKRWEDGVKQLFEAKPGDKIVGELSRTSSIMRDMLNEEFDSILVDDPDTFEDVKHSIRTFSPEKEKIVKLHNGKNKLYETTGLERQIKALFGRTVSLASGGYLVIEHTEALHVIDVNSGNSKTKLVSLDQEAAALQVNLEAAYEIARQLRLRDIGGIIVVDFIDQRSNENRKIIYDKMREFMEGERAKYSILPLSKFGLMQITRQRVRPETTVITTEKCPTCNGTGQITPSILVTDEIEGNLDFILKTQNEKGVSLLVHPFLYSFYTKGLISKQVKWYFKYKKWINLRPDSTLGLIDYVFKNQHGQDIELTTTEPA